MFSKRIDLPTNSPDKPNRSRHYPAVYATSPKTPTNPTKHITEYMWQVSGAQRARCSYPRRSHGVLVTAQGVEQLSLCGVVHQYSILDSDDQLGAIRAEAQVVDGIALGLIVPLWNLPTRVVFGVLETRLPRIAWQDGYTTFADGTSTHLVFPADRSSGCPFACNMYQYHKDSSQPGKIIRHIAKALAQRHPGRADLLVRFGRLRCARPKIFCARLNRHT